MPQLVTDGSSQLPVEEQQKLIEALAAIREGSEPLETFVSLWTERTRVRQSFFCRNGWQADLCRSWDRLLAWYEARHPGIRVQAQAEGHIPRRVESDARADPELMNAFQESLRLERQSRGTGVAFFEKQLAQMRTAPEHQPWTEEREKVGLSILRVIRRDFAIPDPVEK